MLGCRELNKNKPGTLGDKILTIENIRLTDLNELPVKPESYQGKTVFINFWATWCKPCIEEMQSIEKAQMRLKDKNVLFLMASVESSGQIREFEINHPYPFNYVIVQNFEQLNIQALPTTFIFNSMGKQVFSEMGSRNWDDNHNIDLILDITKQHD